MTIAIDSDAAATALKDALCEHLRARGVAFVDLNYGGGRDVDYAAIGYHLACRVRDGEFERGILLCGTGLGMAIIANKVEGVYAGTCHDVYSAMRLRKSNNAQILTMGARVIGAELAKVIVDAWLGAEFEGGGSLPKVASLRALEQQSFHQNNQQGTAGVCRNL